MENVWGIVRYVYGEDKYKRKLQVMFLRTQILTYNQYFLLEARFWRISVVI